MGGLAAQRCNRPFGSYTKAHCSVTVARMDTPKSKKKADFTRLTGGGYDAQEVDQFVSSMRAEVADLSKEVRRRSGGRVADSGAVERLHDPDRAVERMLAAAQQTADRVVYEAEAESERILAEADEDALRRVNTAEANAELHVNEAESQGERIRKEAVTEARRVVEETRGPLAREVKALRDTRDELRTEIDGLRRLLSAHRERVREAAEELRQLADDPDVFRVADPGPQTPVDVDLSDDFVIDVGPEIDLRETPAEVAAAPAAKPVRAKASPAPKTAEAKASPTSLATDPVKPAPDPKPEGRASRSNDRRSGARTAPATAAASDTSTMPEADVPAPEPASPAAAPKRSAFAAAIGEEDEPDPGSAKIVTLDDLGRDADVLWSGDAAEAESARDGAADQTAPARDGRVITGAFADSLDSDDDDSLGELGENAGGGEFLSKVREAATADDGLGQAGDDQDRKISNFFSDAVDTEGKGRFGRRK